MIYFGAKTLLAILLPIIAYFYIMLGGTSSAQPMLFIPERRRRRVLPAERGAVAAGLHPPARDLRDLP